MRIKFSDIAYKEYNKYKLQNEFDKVDKIKNLIESIIQHGVLKGLGKPEVLKHYEPKAYSRRINKNDRLVYRIEEDTLLIITCKGHYDD